MPSLGSGSLCLMFNHTVVAPDVSVQVSNGMETAEAVIRSGPWKGWYKSVVKVWTQNLGSNPPPTSPLLNLVKTSSLLLNRDGQMRSFR